MDFTFSDEQEALRASVRGFLRDRYPIERVAGIADGDGFDRSEWRWVADQGWIGISVPEQDGGAGLSFLDEIVVVEEMGRALYPGPYLSGVILGIAAACAGSHPRLRALVSGERIATVAWAGPDGRFDVDPAPKVEYDEPNDLLTATKMFVPDLASADLLFVLGSSSDGTWLWWTDRDDPGLSWRELPTVDATRRMGEVVFDHTPAWQLAGGPRPALRDRALAALAVEAVGVGSAALDLALGHARQREQFGKAIGSFQAVSHPLAQSFMELETARSLAYWAAWAVDQVAPEAPAAAAAAKARASEAAVSACERAIQAHGGIGFTWEH
ncbi:MAG TPA: acyl-CoA dehydrogenase family protein, partial [Actinomycetota bacterium]|nr:acyl-CoA dehydrogenase family protein [Actinomycetota bacterium]